jgi:hypothetical protein
VLLPELLVWVRVLVGRAQAGGVDDESVADRENTAIGSGSEGAPTLTRVPLRRSSRRWALRSTGAETVLMIRSKLFARWSKVLGSLVA